MDSYVFFCREVCIFCSTCEAGDFCVDSNKKIRTGNIPSPYEKALLHEQEAYESCCKEAKNTFSKSPKSSTSLFTTVFRVVILIHLGTYIMEQSLTHEFYEIVKRADEENYR